MQVYVKKIWSQNPTKRKCVEIGKAVKQYEEYIQACLICSLSFKSFKEWLKTEI